MFLEQTFVPYAKINFMQLSTISLNISKSKYFHLSLVSTEVAEGKFSFTITLANKSLIKRLEMDASYRQINEVESEISEIISDVSLDHSGDRLLSCESSYVVLRSDQLKRIRKFKLAGADPTSTCFIPSSSGE